MTREEILVNKNSTDRILYTACDCYEYEHTVRYTYDTDKDPDFPPELWVDMCINDYSSVWKRIISAFRFIFQRRRYGGSICSLIRKEEIPKIIDFFKDYIKTYNSWVRDLKNGQLTFWDLEKGPIKPDKPDYYKIQLPLSFFKQKLEFPPWKHGVMEYMPIPLFVKAFFKFMDKNKKLPLQQEFLDYYLEINEKNEKLSNILEEEKFKNALIYRIKRNYPSLVRDFILYKQLFQMGYDITYNLENDINGIDLTVINKYGVEVNIHASKMPKPGDPNFRKRKEERHDFKGNHVDIFLNPSYHRTLYDFWYFRKKEDIERLIKKIESFKE